VDKHTTMSIATGVKWCNEITLTSTWELNKTFANRNIFSAVLFIYEVLTICHFGQYHYLF